MLKEFWEAVEPLRQLTVFIMIMALAMVVDSLNVTQLIVSGVCVAVASVGLLWRI